MPDSDQVLVLPEKPIRQHETHPKKMFQTHHVFLIFTLTSIPFSCIRKGKPYQMCEFTHKANIPFPFSLYLLK